MLTSVTDQATESLGDEVFSSAIYGRLSKLYKDRSISDRLSEYSRMEKDHAAFWAVFLRNRGFTRQVEPNKFKVAFYTLAFRLLGVGLTLRMLERGERNAIRNYSVILGSPEVTEDEKGRIRRILEDELDHEYGFEEAESRFKYFLSHVGAAVSGMSYGLVQVLTVSAGLAGAYGDSARVAVGGIVVGLAGGLSVTVGAYTSGRAQRQVRVGMLSRIMMAAEHAPYVFARRIVSYMRDKMMSDETAKTIAVEASGRRELLTRIVAEEEYGLREESLGDPLKDSLYSGLFYVLGAVFPLTPYLFGMPLMTAVPLSLAIAAVMLGLTGLVIAISADLGIKGKALELMAEGLGSAAAIYLLGRLASTLI